MSVNKLGKLAGAAALGLVWGGNAYAATNDPVGGVFIIIFFIMLGGGAVIWEFVQSDLKEGVTQGRLNDSNMARLRQLTEMSAQEYQIYLSDISPRECAELMNIIINKTRERLNVSGK